jgi:hypothetical protein
MAEQLYEYFKAPLEFSLFRGCSVALAKCLFAPKKSDMEFAQNFQQHFRRIRPYEKIN